MKVENGASVTDLVVDGYNTWTGGQYGFYWVTTTNTQADDKVTLRNIRHEGPFASGGATVHIEHNYALSNVLLEQVSGSGTNGFYFRGVSRLLMLSNQCLTSTGVALDITNANMQLVDNFFLGGSTVTTSGMTQISSVGRYTDSSEPVWDFEIWEPSSNSNLSAGVMSKFGGVYHSAGTGTLTNGSNVGIPFGSGSGKSGILNVFAKNSGSTVQVAMSVLITVNNAVLIAGTPSSEVTVTPAGPGAGKLTLHSQGGSALISLFNNLGSTVEYGYTMDWL
jgi:hypothetical protein